MPDGVAVIAPGPEDMKAVGAALAPLVRPGDTVLLGGDLGAGKTTFTQGLAAALGVREPVTSPTFVLLRSYRTSAGWDLLHADVWRLEQLQEVIDLAIPELVDQGAAALVEWGEMAAPALASDCLHVAIDFVVGAPAAPSPAGPAMAAPAAAPAGPAGAHHGAGGSRRVVFRATGPSWDSRLRALAAILDRAGTP